MTYSISGVAEDLPNDLINCNIQHSGAVTHQRSDRTCSHETGPQSDHSVTTTCDHQLQRCVVVKTFGPLQKETKRWHTKLKTTCFSVDRSVLFQLSFGKKDMTTLNATNQVTVAGLISLTLGTF